MYKFVDYKDFDYDNYEYAICECGIVNEGIEVSRGDYNSFVQFSCPRCGKRLGIFVRGKKDPRAFQI